jgi:hypothetical protein
MSAIAPGPRVRAAAEKDGVLGGSGMAPPVSGSVKIR